MTDPLNLCPTVKAKARSRVLLQRSPCPVAKRCQPPYDDRTHNYHRWADGHCRDCQQTIEQVYGRSRELNSIHF